MPDLDLFVIGAGSGGVACARRAASYGAKVAVCEESRIGGTCVNRGCIPKKLLVYASHFREEFEDAASYGWTLGKTEFDWSELVKAKDRELARLNGVYKRMLADSEVAYLPHHGTLVDAHHVKVENETYTARTVLIATGAWPTLPEVSGIDLAITSNEAFDLEKAPERIVIVGGGYIACEFAGIFNGLGVETLLLYRGEMILRGFDDDLRRRLAEGMREKGVDLRLETNVEKIEKEGQRLAATTARGEIIQTDQVMYATGRTPNTHGFGLPEAGVELDPQGALVVDRWSRTNVSNIYAIGDCTDRLKLTPVAIHEGRCLAETLYNDNPQMPDHRDVPTAIFSQPELGTTGLTETEARQECGAVDVYESSFRPLKHTLTGREGHMFMKLVVERESDHVVGCHVLGPGAGELIQLLGILVKSRVTKAQFDATISVHPTSAEEFVTMREPQPQAAE